MTAVEQLTDGFDYSSRALEDDRLGRGPMPADPDRKWGRDVDREFAEFHRALIWAMEPARWTFSRWCPAGEDNHGAVLTNAEAKEIRVTYAEGKLSMKQIADTFDVGWTTIRKVVNGDTYRSAGGPITHRGQGNRPPNRKRAS